MDRAIRNELLNETYETLKQTGWLKSKADFSVNWLRRSERYYSMLDAEKREASVAALMTLKARLEATAVLAAADAGQDTHKSAAAIAALAEKLAATLHERALHGAH